MRGDASRHCDFPTNAAIRVSDGRSSLSNICEHFSPLASKGHWSSSLPRSVNPPWRGLMQSHLENTLRTFHAFSRDSCSAITTRQDQQASPLHPVPFCWLARSQKEPKGPTQKSSLGKEAHWDSPAARSDARRADVTKEISHGHTSFS